MKNSPYSLMFEDNLDQVLDELYYGGGGAYEPIKLSDLVLSARTARLVDVLSALFGELLEAGMTRQELLKCFEETAIRFGFEDDVFFAKSKNTEPESDPTAEEDAQPDS